MRQNFESKVVYPVEFDKVSGMSSRISSLFGRARSGLALGKSQSRSQSPRAFWSAPRHGALE